MSDSFFNRVKGRAAELYISDPDCMEAMMLYAQDLMGFQEFTERMSYLKKCARERAHNALSLDEKGNEI